MFQEEQGGQDGWNPVNQGTVAGGEVGEATWGAWLPVENSLEGGSSGRGRRCCVTREGEEGGWSLECSGGVRSQLSASASCPHVTR